MSWDTFATVAETVKALDEKKVSAVELATHYLDRAEALQATLNAYITIDRAKTLAEAKVADEKRFSGCHAPLLGVPIAHKDIYLIDGWRTTFGSRMLEDFVAPYTSTVVKRMADAGMVTLGKLNMDEFAMGSSTETSYFGPVKNPWDLSRVPGGSSGGSAVAVAAGLASAASATDTGGSIRQPAMFCNVTGLKPTYGICSRYGIIAFASSLDQAGPIARTAEDCAMLLNAMAGFDPLDSTSLDHQKEDYTSQISRPLTGLRIGFPREFQSDDTAIGVNIAIARALETYRKLGATIIDISLPNVKYSIPAYYVIGPAEASSNLSRYDGVRYGYRAKGYADLSDMYKRTRAEGFGAEVKRRILIGTYVLSHGYYDAYYLQAQKLRRLIAEDFKHAYEVCDVVMGPSDSSERLVRNAQRALNSAYVCSAHPRAGAGSIRA